MRLLKLLFVLPLVALLITAAFGVWWVDQPLRFPARVSEQQPLDVEIDPWAVGGEPDAAAGGRAEVGQGSDLAF